MLDYEEEPDCFSCFPCVRKPRWLLANKKSGSRLKLSEKIEDEAGNDVHKLSRRQIIDHLIKCQRIQVAREEYTSGQLKESKFNERRQRAESKRWREFYDEEHERHVSAESQLESQLETTKASLREVIAAYTAKGVKLSYQRKKLMDREKQWKLKLHHLHRSCDEARVVKRSLEEKVVGLETEITKLEESREYFQSELANLTQSSKMLETATASRIEELQDSLAQVERERSDLKSDVSMLKLELENSSNAVEHLTQQCANQEIAIKRLVDEHKFCALRQTKLNTCLAIAAVKSEKYRLEDAYLKSETAKNQLASELNDSKDKLKMIAEVNGKLKEECLSKEGVITQILSEQEIAVQTWEREKKKLEDSCSAKDIAKNQLAGELVDTKNDLMATVKANEKLREECQSKDDTIKDLNREQEISHEKWTNEKKTLESSVDQNEATKAQLTAELAQANNQLKESEVSLEKLKDECLLKETTILQYEKEQELKDKNWTDKKKASETALLEAQAANSDLQDSMLLLNEQIEKANEANGLLQLEILQEKTQVQNLEAKSSRLETQLADKDNELLNIAEALKNNKSELELKQNSWNSEKEALHCSLDEQVECVQKYGRKAMELESRLESANDKCSILQKDNDILASEKTTMEQIMEALRAENDELKASTLCCDLKATAAHTTNYQELHQSFTEAKNENTLLKAKVAEADSNNLLMLQTAAKFAELTEKESHLRTEIDVLKRDVAAQKTLATKALDKLRIAKTNHKDAEKHWISEQTRLEGNLTQAHQRIDELGHEVALLKEQPNKSEAKAAAVDEMLTKTRDGVTQSRVGLKSSENENLKSKMSNLAVVEEKNNSSTNIISVQNQNQVAKSNGETSVEVATKLSTAGHDDQHQHKNNNNDRSTKQHEFNSPISTTNWQSSKTLTFSRGESTASTSTTSAQSNGEDGGNGTPTQTQKTINVTHKNKQHLLTNDQNNSATAKNTTKTHINHQPSVTPLEISTTSIDTTPSKSPGAISEQYCELRDLPLHIDSDFFDKGELMTEGGFSKVYFARSKDDSTNEYPFVMKVMDISQQKILKICRNEIQILVTLNNPSFTSKFYGWFMISENEIALVLERVVGGDLFASAIMEKGMISEDHARVYAAELIVVLEILHSKNIMYRDIKLENMLIDSEGHIKLIDFGLATTEESSTTLCGTPQFSAPEVLCHFKANQNPYGRACDMWSLGVLIFEMITGDLPFKIGTAKRPEAIYKLINNKKNFKFPAGIVTQPAQNLIRGLLKHEPEQRLGFSNDNNIKNHVFFKGLDWDTVARRELSPPFVPGCADGMS
ncbi:hypothetical protein HDU76_010245 [Blyttiomyces sp. JEL0837]|nr:hypothetical protein HDU76_010245 [Blyttiomyces sp. JEL0837]